MAGIFRHGLKTRLKPDYFHQEHAYGEEDQVCHDIIKCCNEMDNGGHWNNALASGTNGQLQTFLRQSMKELCRETAWHQLDAQLKETMSVVLPYALRALQENAILDLSEFRDLLQVGTSRFMPSRALMVHVWRNPKCASNFSNGWSRIWQVIFDHRIEGIHAPYTAMFCIQGTYVSVTALPPVVLTEYPPVFLPGVDGCGDSMLAYMAKQLSAALLLESGVALPICYSRDGRYYILSLKEVMSNKLPGFRGQCVRYELMRQHAIDESTLTYPEYLKRVAIPNAVQHIADELIAQRGEEDRKIAVLVRDKVLRNAFHKFGINFCLLYQVLAHVEEQIKELSGDEGEGQQPQQSSATAIDHLRVVAAAIKVEMIGRTLKQFARTDLHFHTTEGKLTDEERLECVNRLAQFTASKNADFWNEQMLPAVRRKFSCPDTFLIPHSQAVPPAALKIMTAKIGCEFSNETQRFAKFVPVSTVLSLFVAMVIPKSADKEAEVRQLWSDALKLPAHSVRQRVFVARAIVRSALLKSEQRDRAHVELRRWMQASNSVAGKNENGDAASDEPADGPSAICASAGTSTLPTNEVFLEYLRLSALLAEYLRTDAEVQRHFKLLREYVPRDRIEVERNAGIRSMQMLRMVLLRIVAEPPGTLLPVEEAMDAFHAMRWADFTYNDIIDFSLQAIEAEAAYLTIDQLQELHRVVAAVKAKYTAISKRPHGVRYVQRVLKSFLNAPKARTMDETCALAAQSLDENHAVFGVEHYRSMTSVYYLAFFASWRAGDEDRAKATAKLIEIVHDTDAERHRGIAIAGPTLELLVRTHRELEHRDPATAARIMNFVHYFGEWYLATLMMQRVGRGYLERSRFCSWVEIIRRKQMGDRYNPWVPRLTRFFQRYAPARVVEVEGLVVLHRGKERELMRRLEKEYGGKEPSETERIPPDRVNFQVKHAIDPKTTGAPTESTVDDLDAIVRNAAIADTLDIDDIIRDIFNVCDTDRDGRVTAAECHELLRSMAIINVQVLDLLLASGRASQKLTFVQFRDLVLTGHVTAPAGV